ncbi:MAG: hypothetical protein HY699_13735 [Deltaproteobacteria bacterium]|nr:hypothetical protein [Deltaproteobacteria bacterium]
MTLRGVQFVSDAEGNRTGVLIDLKRHRRVWEDFYDIMVAESRAREPRVDWKTVRERLLKKHARRD